MTRTRLLASGASLALIIASAVTVLTLACADSTGPGTEGVPNFGAQVNGTAWTPANGGEFGAVLTPQGLFTVYANRRGDQLQYIDAIQVAVFPVRGAGRYPLIADSGQGSYRLLDRVTFQDTLFLSPANNGELEITVLDTVTHRVAGRFSFQAKQVGGDRWVRIDGGVFRVDYTTVSP